MKTLREEVEELFEAFDVPSEDTRHGFQIDPYLTLLHNPEEHKAYLRAYADRRRMATVKMRLRAGERPKRKGKLWVQAAKELEITL